MIFIGTSGFQYADWRGSFYPQDIANSAMLRYYAAHFDVVELNFTYYKIPGPRTIARMVEEMPDSFRFFVKANEATTHKQDRTVAGTFKAAIQPAFASGKLSGILAQFPWSFKNLPQNRQYLAALREDFQEYPLVVEFRHTSWIRPPVFQFMREMGLGFCCVDEPKIPGLVPPVAEVTSDTAYVRFHSRDASRWFGGDPKERYNYLYSKEELAEWIPRIRKLADEVKRIYIFFNNCHAGQAAVNATQFKNMLDDLGMLSTPNE
jgi:uncharacterized protein YecE (DUF72 family)